MGLYKLAAAVALSLLYLAGLGGYKLGVAKHDKLLIKIQDDLIQQYKDAEEKAKRYEEISIKYYQQYQAAINREPTVITDRVFVKAECPALPKDSGGSMGDGAGTDTRAELHRETVARIAAVTDAAGQDVMACRAKLASLQAKIKAHNAQ